MSQLSTVAKDPTTETAIFTRDAVTALAERLNEPAWMREKRQTAWAVFEETPMPTLHDEDWRRTDISGLKWDQLRRPEGSSRPFGSMADRSMADLPDYLRAALDEGQKAAGRLALVNGQVAYYELAEELVERGVIFTDMTTAVREHPDLVQPYFMTECVTPGDGKFPALHAALWQGGAFIYVPDNVEIKQPFQVAIALEGTGTAIFPHTLIVVGRSAAVTCIEETVSPDGAGQALNDGVVEIIAGDGAQVHYAEVQRWGDNVYSFNTKRAVHRPDSRVVWEMGQLGSRLTKTYVDSILTGNGSSAEFNGVYFASGQQHLDLDTLTHHVGRGTGGDLLLKGAARDHARAVFQGMIKIEPGGQQTNAYLKNDNLLLTDHARVDSIPSLKIDANDVRASHGATVGRVDEEQVFYLESRGIPRDVVVRMVVEGFFSSVFDRMSQERVREKLAAAVAVKMGN